MMTQCEQPEPIAKPPSAKMPSAKVPAPKPRTESSDTTPKLTPRERDRRGDVHLKAGRFAAAIADFDAFLAAEPRFAPEHWRRGIAYYYAKRYREGVAQFESHRTVNADDVENAVWHYLCKAKLDGVDAARKALLPVGPDSRVPMMTIYEMFAGRKSPADVDKKMASTAAGGQRESALFYGHLYLGLYHDAAGRTKEARHHIGLAADKHTSSHYMGDIARLHAKLLAK